MLKIFANGLTVVIQLFISHKLISIPKPDLEYIHRKRWGSLI